MPRYAPPLHVHVAFVTGTADSEAISTRIVASLAGESGVHAIPEASLPVYSWPAAASQHPGDIPWEDARRTALILIVDDEMIASPGWRSWANRQVTRRRPADLVLVCALSSEFGNIGPSYSSTHAIRCFDINAVDRVAETLLLVIHSLVRWFSAPAGPPNGKVRLFISHAKAAHRGVSGRVLARDLKKFIDARPAGEAFFDEVDIVGGDDFAATLDANLSGASVIVLLTDKFPTRFWCGWEVATAREKHSPLLVVDALQEGTPVSVAALGKAPVIRWNAGEADEHSKVDTHRTIVGATLLETLRIAHESARTSAVKELIFPNDPSVLTSGFSPELSLLPSWGSATTLLYPDPPLAAFELRAIASLRPGLRVLSATQALAQFARLGPGLEGKCVALSISDGPDQSARGITPSFRDRLWTALNLHLLLAGADVAYGGDLRNGGLTERLYDLARATADAGRSLRVGAIRWYAGWPVAARVSLKERAAIPPAIEPIWLGAPSELEGMAAPPTMGPSVVLTHEQRYSWTLSMSDMRAAMARDCHARILIGGQMRGVSPWPGLLEEFETCVGKPLFLVGGLGGMARVLSRSLRGERPEELTQEFQNAGDGQAAHAFFTARSAAAPFLSRRRPELTQSVGALQELGVSGLRNGLSVEENGRLFESRDITEIVGLVLKGLVDSLHPLP